MRQKRQYEYVSKLFQLPLDVNEALIARAEQDNKKQVSIVLIALRKYLKLSTVAKSRQ